MRWLAAALVLAGSVAHADDQATAPAAAPDPEIVPPRPKTPFDQGKFALSIGGGTQDVLGHHYYVLGAGVGYYVLDGLGVHLSGLVEFGADPFIAKLSPEVRYVAQPLVGRSPFIPYVGVFFNHWFVTGMYPDVDTVGARAGLMYISGALILGAGAAVEHTVSSCSTDCNQLYPDFIISMAL
jgi:hypothetical protein